MSINLKKELDKLINTAENITLTTHLRPDHDAICSTLALYYYVNTNFPSKKARIVLEKPENKTWEELANFELVKWVGDLGKEVDRCDLIMLTDANSWNRATKNPENIRKHPAVKVCIDHHQTEGNDKFELKYVDKTAAAATQIMAEELFDNLKAIPKEVLETLILGIIGDTGKFSFINSVNARVLGTAQKIITAGDLLVEKVFLKFGKIHPQELEVTAKLLENTRFAEIPERPNIMYSFLKKEIIKVDPVIVQNAYHNFMGNYLRQVDGYPWGFVVVPMGGGEYKVSFRSINGGPSVLAIAEHFGGGGHIPATACTIEAKDKTPLEICNMVLKIIVVY